MSDTNPNDPQQLVQIAHADSGGEATTSREAFELVWADKGWTIVEDNTGTPDAVTPTNRPAARVATPPQEA